MDDKSFFYRNKLYPFNFSLFKRSSKYLSQYSNQYEKYKIINLIEGRDSSYFSEDSINNFINFCQSQKYKVTNSNVIYIHILSINYDIVKLTQFTNFYISRHYNEIIKEFLSDKPSNIINNITHIHEQIISEHLPEFLDGNNIGLLSLPIPFLYRILMNYSQIVNSSEEQNIDESNNKKIKIFLIQIVQKYGTESKTIFTNIDFGDNNDEYLCCILPYFCTCNDTIESKLLKALYSKVIKNEEENYKNQEEVKKEIDQIKKNSLHLADLVLINSKKNMNTFNNFDGEKQKSVIDLVNEIDDNEQIKNVGNLLSFISNETDDQHRESNYIFKFPDSENKKNDDNLDYSKIGITNIITEMLYEKGFLQTLSFKHHIEEFKEFYIEIKYPSLYFENIYQTVINMKKQMENIKIGINIIGQSSTDIRFNNNQFISYIKTHSGLKKIVNDGNKGSFSNCSFISQFLMSSSIYEIGNFSFSGCHLLKELIIPPSVTTIKDNGFYECKALCQVKLPSSVTNIGNSAFEGCSNLYQIEFDPYNTRYQETTFKRCPLLSHLIITTSKTIISKYDYKKIGNIRRITILSQITKIGQSAFIELDSLSSISIPPSLKIICCTKKIPV